MGKKYENAPVVEALCEIFFDGSKWDSTLPGLFFERIKDVYPKKKELEQSGVEVSVSKDTQDVKVLRGNQRIQFIKDDGSQLVQIEKDLLVINQLRPYPRFVEWKPAIDKMIKLYRELAKPNFIKRVGIRYINRIEIPSNKFKMEDYFYLYPEVPVRLGAMHGKFMMRLEIPPKNREGHQLVVTFGTAPVNPSPTSLWMFDLMFDLYDIFTLPPDMSLEQFDRYVLEAHDNIETAFEESITDKMKELFKEV